MPLKRSVEQEDEPTTGGEYLSREEACELLGIKIVTLRKYVKLGYLEAQMRGSHIKGISVLSLNRIMSDHSGSNFEREGGK